MVLGQGELELQESAGPHQEGRHQVPGHGPVHPEHHERPHPDRGQLHVHPRRDQERSCQALHSRAGAGLDRGGELQAYAGPRHFQGRALSDCRPLGQGPVGSCVIFGGVPIKK
eukprot:15470944-Alexandrium_andersonii.AAC.1